MNPHLLLAGLFENPWVVAAFVLAGGIINWLSKRRAENAAKNPPPKSAPPAAGNWMDRLQQMLEEYSQATPRPPVPLASAPPLKPAPVPPRIHLVPPSPPPLLPVTRPANRPSRPLPVETFSTTGSAVKESVLRRYELSEAAHAAHALHGVRRQQQAKAKTPILGSLRRPTAARQAFAASVVLGPPKGLEL